MLRYVLFFFVFFSYTGSVVGSNKSDSVDKKLSESELTIIIEDLKEKRKKSVVDSEKIREKIKLLDKAKEKYEKISFRRQDAEVFLNKLGKMQLDQNESSPGEMTNFLNELQSTIRGLYRLSSVSGPDFPDGDFDFDFEIDETYNSPSKFSRFNQIYKNSRAFSRNSESSSVKPKIISVKREIDEIGLTVDDIEEFFNSSKKNIVSSIKNSRDQIEKELGKLEKDQEAYLKEIVSREEELKYLSKDRNATDKDLILAVYLMIGSLASMYLFTLLSVKFMPKSVTIALIGSRTLIASHYTHLKRLGFHGSIESLARSPLHAVALARWS